MFRPGIFQHSSREGERDIAQVETEGGRTQRITSTERRTTWRHGEGDGTTIRFNAQTERE